MRQRIVTALLLFLVFLPLVYWAPSSVFRLFLAVIFFFALDEWLQLARIAWHRGWAVSGSLVFAALTFSQGQSAWLWAVAAGVFWLLAPIVLWRARTRRAQGPATPHWMAALALPVLFPAFLLAAALQGQRPSFLLWIVLLVSATDILALAVGKTWGRSPLAPWLSPAKTWEGLFGGLLAGLMMGTLGTVVLIGSGLWTLAAGATLGVLVAAFGVVGDLLESLLKRRSGRKDSGRLLPGHGGVLDRIDAMLAGIPVFVLGLIALGWWK
ncbi:MAG: phosphatidate cytidylyltransferase [Acidithiobacillus sp.]